VRKENRRAALIELCQTGGGFFLILETMGKTFVHWNEPSSRATGDKTKWGESLQFNDGA